MDDPLEGDELGFDRQQHCTSIGAIGGKARTPEKLAAIRANIAKARIQRAWYRRHPELRPERLAAAAKEQQAEQQEEGSNHEPA